MNYQAQLNPRQNLHLQNEGEQTSVTLSGAGQNQSSRFSTGKWSQKPQVLEVGEGFVVQISTDAGEKYLAVELNDIHFLDEKPDVGNSKPIELEESEAQSAPPLKPMEPMKPMKPMNFDS